MLVAQTFDFMIARLEFYIFYSNAAAVNWNFGLDFFKPKMSNGSFMWDSRELLAPFRDFLYCLLSTKTRHLSERTGVCVVCVLFPFIMDVKFVRCTSRGHTGGRSHRISHLPSFCGTCLYFSRVKDSTVPFPRRPWSRILCANNLLSVLHLLGFFLFKF